MSAVRDHKTPIRFYFGNAYQDLAHLLPPEDIASSGNLVSDNHLVLDSVEKNLAQLKSSFHELCFLVEDLNRLVRVKK